MNTSDKKRDIKSGAVEFPQFPGEDCLAHTASTYQEQLDARLTGLGLLAVAQGHPPASVACIIDQPLDDLPALDPTHRDFNRREEARSKAKVERRQCSSAYPADTGGVDGSLHSPQD